MAPQRTCISKESQPMDISPTHRNIKFLIHPHVPIKNSTYVSVKGKEFLLSSLAHKIKLFNSFCQWPCLSSVKWQWFVYLRSIYICFRVSIICQVEIEHWTRALRWNGTTLQVVSALIRLKEREKENSCIGRQSWHKNENITWSITISSISKYLCLFWKELTVASSVVGMMLGNWPHQLCNV